jgi:hypothetical protein
LEITFPTPPIARRVFRWSIQAGLLAQASSPSPLPGFPVAFLGGFFFYSGGTARDLHPTSLFSRYSVIGTEQQRLNLILSYKANGEFRILNSRSSCHLPNHSRLMLLNSRNQIRSSVAGSFKNIHIHPVNLLDGLFFQDFIGWPQTMNLAMVH